MHQKLPKSNDVSSLPKKSRKSIALEVKLDILKRIESGEKAADVARILCLPSSTVRTIHKDASRILQSAENGNPLSSKVISKKTNVMEGLENQVSQWGAIKNGKSSNISQSIIQEKALMLFQILQDQNPDNSSTKKEQFTSNSIWLDQSTLSQKRPPSDSVSPVSKKSRKSIALEVKLDVLNRIEKGEKAADVARVLGLPSSTVRTIHKDADRIRKSAEHANPLSSKMISKKRSNIMERLEKQLLQWVNFQNEKGSSVSQATIQGKALTIFKALQNQEPEDSPAKKEQFIASRGWFDRFRKRQSIHSTCVTRESRSTNVSIAQNFKEDFQKIVEEGGYSPEQIFNVSEAGLFWKKMPSRTSISENERSTIGLMASKDRLTLLLGGNVAGDKLKPLLVYHNENPRALQNVAKSELPVTWKSHQKACMTREIFRDWFTHCFVPFTEEYCQKKKKDFKILLVLDNAMSHEINFEALCPTVRVVFFPPNTAFMLQPMDMGINALFKAYYLRRTLQHIIEKTDGDDKPTVSEFWKLFNILNGIEILSSAWHEVTSKCMNTVWKSLLPKMVFDFVSFDEIVPSIERDCVILAKKAGFKEVDVEDVQDTLASHFEKMTERELIQLAKQELSEEEEDSDVKEQQTLTLGGLREQFSKLDNIICFFKQLDPNQERSAKVSQDLLRSVACYQEIFQTELQATEKNSIAECFVTLPNSSTSSGEQSCPSTSENFMCSWSSKSSV